MDRYYVFSPCPISRGGPRSVGGSHVQVGGAGVRGVGPCIVKSTTSWVMVTGDSLCGQTDWPTNMYENITFPQLRWQAVMMIAFLLHLGMVRSQKRLFY